MIGFRDFQNWMEQKTRKPMPVRPLHKTCLVDALFCALDKSDAFGKPFIETASYNEFMEFVRYGWAENVYRISRLPDGPLFYLNIEVPEVFSERHEIVNEVEEYIKLSHGN